VGTDSNVLIDAAGELRALEYAQRLTARARNVTAGRPGASTGARLFDAARAGGTQALGAAPAELAEGAVADIVSLDPADATLAARAGEAILDAWIFAARRPLVDRVWRRGRLVVEGGRHLARGPIEAAYRAALARVLA
jgi:cytosine/adenosine deaminase-related metal-dependent hydrolase